MKRKIYFIQQKTKIGLFSLRSQLIRMETEETKDIYPIVNFQKLILLLSDVKRIELLFISKKQFHPFPYFKINSHYII